MARQDAPWQDEALLREKYLDDGLTIQEIADEWDTTFDTIRYYKDKFGIEGRQNNVDPRALELDAETLERKYWLEGKSLNEIGEEHGVGGVYVLDCMKEHGIPRRTPDHEKGTAWKDEDTLRELYWEEGLTLEEIGQKLGCEATTISNWMKRFGVEREPIPEEKPPNYRVTNHGYEIVRTKVDGEQRSTGVHQLIAISQGADPHKVFSGGEYHCHHKNGIPWDNRPENIELLPRSEHRSLHYEDMEIGDNGEFV